MSVARLCRVAFLDVEKHLGYNRSLISILLEHSIADLRENYDEYLYVGFD